MTSPTDSKRRFILIVSGIALTLIIGFIGVLFFASSGSQEKANSAVGVYKTSAVDSQEQVAGVGSPEFNENLKKYDEKKADQALQSGKSYISTPIADSKPLVAKETPAAAPPPVATQQTYTPAKKPVQENSELRKRTFEDMAAIQESMNGRRTNGKVEFVAAIVVQEDPSSNPTGPGSSLTSNATIPVKSGDILYAIVDTAINSDVPSAVLATIVSGDLKNYRLIGSFQRFDERMVVAFNRLISATGQEFTIESYAIDPSTTEASVASRVNTRFFERWGGLLAASFLEGFGEARRFSGATSFASNVGTTNSENDNFAWGDYSLADQAWIAAGNVGKRAGRIMERNFERPPTVYLSPGAEVGILIVNVKK